MKAGEHAARAVRNWMFREALSQDALKQLENIIAGQIHEAWGELVDWFFRADGPGPEPELLDRIELAIRNARERAGMAR